MNISVSLQAQYLSLSDNEVSRLKQLIVTDKVAAEVYLKWEELANKSLHDNPNPIDTIESEGRLISYPKKQLSIQSFRDMNKVYALAITYRITGKKVYLNKAIDFIVAWGSVNHSIGNPINDMKLDLMVEAYDLIYSKVPKKAKEKVNTWLTQIVIEELKTQNEKYNNWNSFRIRIITQIAFLLNNKQYINDVKKMLEIQILKNLYANGSSTDFEYRDALHYHTYTLDPLLKASIIIKRATGENYFIYQSPTTSSIKKSVDFLLPYANGDKHHKEFVNSSVKIDRARAAQKEPGFEIGGDFETTKALDVFAYSTYFNKAYSSTLNRLLIKKHQEPLPTGTIIIDTSMYSYWLPILNEIRSN